MSLTVQMKTDYSNVITRSMQPISAGNSTDMNGLTKTMLGGGGDNTLIDYAALKNGSYGKLLKAYYSEVGGEETPKKAVAEDEKTTNKKVELVQDALNGKSSSKSSTDSTYNVTAEKINALSDQVSTLFNGYA